MSDNLLGIPETRLPVDPAARLLDEGVEVRGVIDHEGIWNSIYFFDPNGVRLELTYQSRALTDEDAARAV